MTHRVGIIGIGTVGSMLVRAHSRFGNQEQFKVEVSTRSPHRVDSLLETVPDLPVAPAESIASRASLLIPCIPAEAYLQTVADLALFMRQDAVLVCVSSAVDLDVLTRMAQRPVVRMIPSLAHSEGRGVSLLVRGSMASSEHLHLVRSFMEPISLPMEVADAEVRFATNITGCGPAILACFAQLLSSSAARSIATLPGGVLEQMAAETLSGVAAMLDADWSLSEITKKVATTGGTTEAAVSVLRQRLPNVLTEMHQATIDRQALLRRPTG